MFTHRVQALLAVTGGGVTDQAHRVAELRSTTACSSRLISRRRCAFPLATGLEALVHLLEPDLCAVDRFAECGDEEPREALGLREASSLGRDRFEPEAALAVERPGIRTRPSQRSSRSGSTRRPRSARGCAR